MAAKIILSILVRVGWLLAVDSRREVGRGHLPMTGCRLHDAKLGLSILVKVAVLQFLTWPQ